MAKGEISMIVFTFVLLVVGAICAYLYYLDKKGSKMRETEEGQREYANKYLPERLKYKTKTVGKANSRNRMSKKERRKLNSNQKEK